MPIYHKLGKFPHKRHTIFRKEDGSLFHEQLFGTVGFDGMSSIMYHHYPPTMVIDLLASKDIAPKIAHGKSLKSFSMQGFSVKPTADFMESRVPVLVNSDCKIILSAPTASVTS